jgi:hypothetical protein
MYGGDYTLSLTLFTFGILERRLNGCRGEPQRATLEVKLDSFLPAFRENDCRMISDDFFFGFQQFAWSSD